jgi:hypothetical protein
VTAELRGLADKTGQLLAGRVKPLLQAFIVALPLPAPHHAQAVGMQDGFHCGDAPLCVFNFTLPLGFKMHCSIHAENIPWNASGASKNGFSILPTWRNVRHEPQCGA